MTDETARAGKRGPACSKVMELNHCPSSSDDGQERIPQPMNAVDSVPESVPARRHLTTGRNGFRNGIHCVHIYDHWLELGACFVHTRTTETKVKERLAQQKSCISLFGLGAHGKHVPVTHTRPVPLFIQPLPLSRRGLDSAVLPSYSCRNLYIKHTSMYMTFYIHKNSH